MSDEFRREFQGYQQRTWATGANGMMNVPVEQESAVEIVLMNGWLEDNLKCEASLHPTGTYGHRANEPASYLVRFPCCDASRPYCAGWVAAVPNYGGIICFACGVVIPTTDATVVPI